MMLRSSRSARRLLAVAFVVSFVVSACGDDAQEARDEPDDRTTTTTTSTDDPPDGDTDTGSGRVFDELPHACDLVAPEEVAALIGPAEVEAIEDRALDGARYTQCLWDGDDGTSLLAVSVVDTPARHELHRRILPDFEELEGLGDQALAAPGVSSETRGATGGRTVSVRLGEISVVVALRLEGVTPVDDVRPVAETVLARLA